MGKEKKYLVNNSMFVFAVVYIVLLVAVSIALVTIERYGSAVVFALISLPFFLIAFRYGSVVKVGKDGVSLSFLGIKRRFISWKNMAEVDVIGSKVLNRNNTKKCGTLYLIFSPEKLDDEKRFDMMLKWPPKDKIYLKFTKDRLMDLQWFYSNPVEKYNIGMLDI